MEATFAPVKSPMLGSTSREALTQFMDELVVYQDLVKQWQDLGHKVAPRPLKACVDRQLLRRLCALELKGAVTPETVTDDALKALLKNLREPRGSLSQKIDAVFGQLSCDLAEKDPRERVAKLFGSAIEIRTRELLDKAVTDKQLAGFIVKALRPEHLRVTVESDLEYEFRDLRKDLPALFEHISTKSEKFEEVYRAQARTSQVSAGSNSKVGSTTSSGRNRDGQSHAKGKQEPSHQGSRNYMESQRDAFVVPARTSNYPTERQHVPDREIAVKGKYQVRAPRDGCLKCRGDHWLRDCPHATPQQKEALLQASRATRSGGGTGEKSLVSKVNSVRVPVDKLEPAPAELRPTLFVNDSKIPIPYSLDSGADVSVMSKKILDEISRDTFISLRHLDPPLLCMTASGSAVRVSQKARIDLRLETASGLVSVRRVECAILPGEADLFLVGLPDMESLGLTPPQAQLEAIAAGLSTRQVHSDPLQHIPVDTVLPREDDDSGEFELDDRGSQLAQDDLDQAIRDMLQRAQDAGAPEDYMVGVRELVANKFRDLWRLTLGCDPPAKVRPMGVTIMSGKEFKAAGGVRRYAETQRTFLHEEVADLLRLGLVTRTASSSAWSSPVVLARKHDGSWRMCVDLRQVNAITEPLPFPIPRLEELVQHLREAKVFALFDMVKGYWQFPLEEGARKYFTFATHEGLFEPTRVPMGAKNAVRHFQSVMTELLGDLLYIAILVYLDDILAHGKDTRSLLKAVEDLFTTLQEAGIKLHPRKCVLFAKSITWCGHVISAEGVRVSPERVAALIDIPDPHTAAELQQFLAAANWMRLKLPEYAKTIEPLQDLLNRALEGKRRTSSVAAGVRLDAFGWERIHADAVACLKNLLQRAVTLGHPDPEKEFCLFTDASSTHWGSVLTQVPVGQRGKVTVAEMEHIPLAFLSGVFRGASMRWSVADKEAYAIRESCVRLDYLLHRRKGFTIFTDHRNLQYIFDPACRQPKTSRAVSDRLERWALQLRSFDYDIEHLSGVENVWADLLSRWGASPDPRGSPVALHVFVKTQVPAAVDEFVWPKESDILSAQRRSVVDGSALGLLVTEGDLLRDHRGRVFVPDVDELRLRICVVAHAGAAGHRGLDATLLAIESQFTWENVKDDVYLFLSGCLHCVKLRDRHVIPRPLGNQIQAEKRNEVIHFDFISLPVAANGMEKMLVMKEDFSQFVELVPCSSASAEVVVEALLLWFSRFGVVRTWISDQGSHFKNEIMRTLNTRLKGNHHFTVVYSPWANGGIERANKEMLRVLRVILLENKMEESQWPSLVPVVQAVLNHSPLDRLAGLAPVEVFTGLERSHPIQSVLLDSSLVAVPELKDVSESIQNHAKALQELLQSFHVQTEIARERRTRARREAQGRVKVDFALGDFVLVAATQPGKLQPFWQGPFRVVDTVSDWVYVVESLGTGRSKEVHCARIMLYAEKDLGVTANLRLAAEHDEVPLVDHFVAHRAGPAGNFEILVRWLGFEEANDTWEPLHRLLEDVPAMIRSYVKESGDAALLAAISLA